MCRCRSWNPGCSDTINSVAYYINLLQGSLGAAIRSLPYHDQSLCRPQGCPSEQPICKVVNATANALDPSQGCALPDCSDAEPHCTESSLTGVRARQICPVTCGCDQP